MTQNILRGNVSTILKDLGQNAQDRNGRRSRDDHGNAPSEEAMGTGMENQPS